MKKWLQHIIKGNSFQGLEFFHLNGNTFYALIKLQQKSGELHVVSEDVFQDIEEVAPEVDKKNPLVLVINASQILKKQVSLDSKLDSVQKVIQAFPNLDLEKFYYEILDTKGLEMVSIGKKEHLNELFLALKNSGIVPSKVSLGVSDLGASIPYLKDACIQGSNFQLQNVGGSDFKLKPDDSGQQTRLETNGLKLSNTSLLSFSGVLGYIMGSNKTTNLMDLNQQFKDRFQNYRIFNIGLKWGLGFMLATLLINFAFFSHYHRKVMAMESGYDIEQQQELLQSTKERVAQKEQRLDKVLGASSSKSTFYLDRLGLSLPNTVLLDEMTYQPLLKPIREGKAIQIERKSILISGQSSDKLQFAQWTELIEKKEWIETVEVLSYGYASKSLDEFTLEIDIDDAGY